MVTRAYLENIFNKSKVTAMPYEDKYMCMLAELPNGTIINVGTKVIKSDVKTSIDICKEMIIDEICKYEKYVQADKDRYNYDLSDEYIEEYGEGGDING